MWLLCRIGLPVGASIATLLVATAPATADSTPGHSALSVHDAAHVWFEDPLGGNHNTMVDLDRTDGQVLLDVEWFDVTCDGTQAPRTCLFTYREAYDVVPTTAELSLDRATVTADLTYNELHRTCVYTPTDSGAEHQACTDAPRTSGTTTLDLTWTGVGEVTRYEYRDAQGMRHIVWQRNAQASGTAFGERYPVEFSLITQLAHSVTVA
jgi:hypothetical protein